MEPHAGARERKLAMFLALSLFFPFLNLGATNRQGDAPPPSDKLQSPGAISVNVELVVLHATVRDRKGRFVSGLQMQDFQVYEDDQQQTIESFQHEDVPVAVGLVVDSSGSMQSKQSDVAAAVSAFAKSSNNQDEMFLVNFNENVTFGLRDTALLSASPSEFGAALMRVPAMGLTAL